MNKKKKKNNFDSDIDLDEIINKKKDEDSPSDDILKEYEEGN
jgi:hypothetical protein